MEAHWWFSGCYQSTSCGFFLTSKCICLNESMTRWYGKGHLWLGVGIPTYISIDRKPKRGFEIHSSRCGRSKVILRLCVLNSDQSSLLESERDLPQGTKDTLELVRSWLDNYRAICGDSHIASVSTAMELHSKGMNFIGDTGLGWSQQAIFISTVGSTRPGDGKGRVRWFNRNGDSAQERKVIQLPSLVREYHVQAWLIGIMVQCRTISIWKRLYKWRNGLYVWILRYWGCVTLILIIVSWRLWCCYRKVKSWLLLWTCYTAYRQFIWRFWTSFARFWGSWLTEVQPVSGSTVHLSPTRKYRGVRCGRIGKAKLQLKCRICRMKSRFPCSASPDISLFDLHFCAPKYRLQLLLSTLGIGSQVNLSVR